MTADIRLHPDLQALIDDHWAFVLRLHQSNSLAPLAATMDLADAITGVALVEEKAPSDADKSTPDTAVGILTSQFIAAAQRGAIKASAIFFHGYNDRRAAPRPAENAADANCLVVFLDHRDGQAVAAIINYLQDSGGIWRYAAPSYHLKKPLVFGEKK